MRDERGVSAVIVAVSMIAIFGAAMLSVDAGNLWQTRRGVITGTDAGALAEAQALAFSTTSPTSCTTTSPPAWLAALQSNTQGFPAASYTGADEGCTYYPGITNGLYNGTGYVTVAARRLSQAKFGNVLGIGDTRAYSLSAAMYGFVQGFKGLRPLGVCINNSHIREWKALKNEPVGENILYFTRDSDGDGTPDHLEDGISNDFNGNGVFDQTDYNNLPSTEPGEDGPDQNAVVDPIEKDHPNDEYTGASWYSDSKAPHVIHRLRVDRDASEDLACGNDPGNWGYLDFDEGSNSQGDLAEWFLDGYQKNFVGIPGCNANGGGPGCSGDPSTIGGGAQCDKKTTKVAEALQCLVEGQIEFPIVVYDTASCTTQGQGGGGSNCRYRIAAMVGVILRGFDVSGPQAERRYDVEFTDIIVSGGCCVLTQSGLNLGANKGVKLCAVDHDPLTLDVRCLAR